MLCVMGAIFFLSHQPADELQLPAFPGMDKIAHTIAYMTLAGTVILAHGKKSWFEKVRTVSLTTLGVTVLYGISDEFHQYFIPGRYPDFWDIVADALGGVLAIILFTLLIRKFSGIKDN